MRNFEKISVNQLKKDVGNDINYNDIQLPKRSTKNSAGYDFYSIEAFKIKPGEIKKIPTGIKVQMNNDEVLLMFIRSSIGFKYNVRLTNQTGIIDSDYYNNLSNEGHIFVSLQNEGKETFCIKSNEKFVQGVFIKYLTTDSEEEIIKQRNGGIGSTN